MRYENLLKDAENKKTNKITKNNQIFSTLRMKGIKYNLQDILDNNIDFLEPSVKRKKLKEGTKQLIKNKSSEMLLKTFYAKRKHNKVKFKIIKNIFSHREFKSIKNSQPNSVISPSKIFQRNDFKSSTRNPIKINCSDCSTTKFINRKSKNYSMDRIQKIIKPLIENTPSKNTFENSNNIEETPNVKNSKETNKIYKINRDSQILKIKEYSDKKIINLPKLIKNRLAWRKNDNIQLNLNRGIKNYKDFYKIYNFDKSILASNEFKIELMKENNKKEEKINYSKSNKLII
jgi:hypothetical protein